MIEIDNVIHAFESDDSVIGQNLATEWEFMLEVATKPEPLTPFERLRIDRRMYQTFVDHSKPLDSILAKAGLLVAFNDAFNEAFECIEDKVAALEAGTTSLTATAERANV